MSCGRCDRSLSPAKVNNIMVIARREAGISLRDDVVAPTQYLVPWYR